MRKKFHYLIFKQNSILFSNYFQNNLFLFFLIEVDNFFQTKLFVPSFVESLRYSNQILLSSINLLRMSNGRKNLPTLFSFLFQCQERGPVSEWTFLLSCFVRYLKIKTFSGIWSFCKI